MMRAESLTGVLSHPRKFAVLGLLSCWLLKYIVCYQWHRRIYRRKLQERRNKAEQRNAAVIKQYSDKTLPTASTLITKKTVSELLTEIKSGKITAVQVLHAFQRQALELSKEINCVVEALPEAERQARLADESPDKSGLLHGLPVSVKENIHITGYDSTVGLSAYIGDISDDDAVVIKVLKKHGAIPFVRTNLPQTMMSYCCSNPIYGETLNPIDKSRGPGGSSGGEGAILGGGGSVIGIGTDIGGSLRIPAEFCGVYALKPTTDRISTKGILTMARGNVAIQGAVGPMARDFESLVHLSRALMSPEMIKLDGAVPNLPFDLKVFEDTKKLRIGYYTYDGTCTCQPPVVRAVLEARNALEAMGHELVEFDFPTLLGSGFKNGEHYIRLIVADGGEKVRKLLGHDDAEAALTPVVSFLSRLPRWLMLVAKYLVGRKDKFSASIIGAAVGFQSMCEYFGHVAKFLDWQDSFMKVWMEAGLDAVICPVFPSPAVRRDIIPRSSVFGLYCQIYNSLNYPSGVVPVTKVTQEDLDRTFDPEAFSPQSYLEKMLLQSSKDSKGLSVGVQCVSLPYREEICLRVMKDVTQGLAKSGHSHV